MTTEKGQDMGENLKCVESGDESISDMALLCSSDLIMTNDDESNLDLICLDTSDNSIEIGNAKTQDGIQNDAICTDNNDHCFDVLKKESQCQANNNMNGHDRPGDMREEILAKIQANLGQYKDHPELLQYFDFSDKCIVCELNSVENKRETAPESPPSSEKIAEPKEKNQRFRRIQLERMGLDVSNCAASKNEEIPRTTNEKRICSALHIIAYLDSISPLCTGYTIKRFDLDAFFHVLIAPDTGSKASNAPPASATSPDSFAADVLAFTDRLLLDPLEYDQSDKVKFFYILVFSYIFRKQRNCSTHEHQKKIKCLSAFFKPCKDFDIDIINDPFIDIYIAQMRAIPQSDNAIGPIHREAAFLNRLYISYKTDKNFMAVFHRRIMLVIERMDAKYAMDFLKYVFTFATVLYFSILESELYLLIFSFYKKNLKSDLVFEYIDLMIDSVDQAEFYDLFVKEFGLLPPLNSIKYKKRMHLIELRGIKDVAEYRAFFNANLESFDAVTTAVREIDEMYEFVVPSKYTILEVLLEMMLSIKDSFLENAFRMLVHLLIKIISSIQNDILKDSQSDDLREFREFNKAHWCKLSDVMFRCNTILLETEDDAKKKKSSRIQLSARSKLLMRLFEEIYKIEEIGESKMPGMAKIKRKGFRIQ